MKKQCPKIMIVEDDADIREAMCEFLELEGYGVETFSNGKDALERIKNLPEPCLVLLDFMMPIMNGLQFMEEFRKHPATIVPIPIYLCSANASEEVKTQLGVTGFIKKPVDLKVLTIIVDQYCETLADWNNENVKAGGGKVIPAERKKDAQSGSRPS
jgi:CheY-like chemotaxis protein